MTLFKPLTDLLPYKPKTVQELIKSIKPKKVEDIFNSQTPSLIKIQKIEDGENKLKGLMAVIVGDLVSFFNVGKTMSPQQVLSTAELLIECYPVYKLDDFILCFKLAKMGHYGKVYDRIDGNVILDWFESYIAERDTEFEKIRVNEQKRLAELNVNEAVPMPPYMKELKQKLLIKKSIEMVPDVEKPRVLVQTEEQKLINKLLFDFNEIWINQGCKTGKKFIEYLGKKIDVSEYLQARYFLFDFEKIWNKQVCFRDWIGWHLVNISHHSLGKETIMFKGKRVGKAKFLEICFEQKLKQEEFIRNSKNSYKRIN